MLILREKKPRQENRLNQIQRSEKVCATKKCFMHLVGTQEHDIHPGNTISLNDAQMIFSIW